MSLKRALNKIVTNKYSIPNRPFYKKHPFQGSTSIKSTDDRGGIDFDLGIFYNRIPKAANSTIITNLVTLKLGYELHPEKGKRLFKAPSALTIEEVKKFDELFKFTVVRDPFSRTLSAYLDKIDRKYNITTEKVSFKDFLISLKKGKLYSNLHWAPQTSILLIPLDEFDFIGKFEKLNTDLSYIISRIKNETVHEFDYSKKGPPSTSATDKIAKYFDKECVELVQEMYSKDFELLDYSNSLDL